MKLITDLQKEENMTREEANNALPTLQAFTEGKVIQMLDDRSIWTDLTEREGLPIGTLGESPNIFRIKPEPKYRPFKDAEECWQEMLKHQPFGWVKEKGDKLSYELLARVSENDEAPISFAVYGSVGMGIIDRPSIEFNEMFNAFTFADSAPFGVKEEV